MPSLNLFIIKAAAITILVLSLPTNKNNVNLVNATDVHELHEFPNTNYSTWDKNVTYKSSSKYYLRGMGPLYSSTRAVLDSFVGKMAIPEGFIEVSEGNINWGPKVEQHEWLELLRHYWGILVIVIITALLVTLMPIVGLCFCCCRCAGACGGRSQPFDKKHDTCRRVFLGLLLICSSTAILFGVVISFATNSYMQEGMNEATSTLRDGSADAQRFLNSTSDQINHLLITNYEQLSNHLRSILNDTSESVINELEDQSKAGSLTYLSEFLENLPEMQKNLQRMKEITNELRVNASQLSDGLRGVKRELLVKLSECDINECKTFLDKYQIGKLDASDIDYNQIPDLSEIINDVEKLIKNNIVEALKNGKEALENLRKELNTTIQEYIPEVEDAIESAGTAIQHAAKDMSGRFKNISNAVENKTNLYVDEADKYIEEYGIYRFYVGVALSSILLLILVSLTCALFCGICGKRPDGYGDDCCNKGSGSRFLMLAIAVIFLSISILAIATLIHFLVGLFLYRGVCVPLRNPDNDQIAQYVDNFIDFNNIYVPNLKNNKYSRVGNLPPFRISHIIIDCKANKSIYEVLRINNHNDIKDILDYPKKFGIDEKLNKLVKNIANGIKLDLKMLSPTDKAEILKLAESDLKKFDADKFEHNLNDNITHYDLGEIAQKLSDTADKIHKNPKMREIYIVLKNQVLHLESYQNKLVLPMTKQSFELVNSAKALEKSLKLRGKPFDESIVQIVDEIEKAQDNIQKYGKTILQKSAKDLSQHIAGEIASYLEFVVESVEKTIGKCAPLNQVYNAGIVAICNKLVDPLNGFWAGLGWCVLIFLPTLIISAKLSTLYQKSDPYPGPLVESEYLYDAYERDNIPLANGPKNKRRKKERRRGSRDRRGDYYEETGGSNTGTGSRDTRYNDMAPKHWDGGPPRYTSSAPPASEYERPPPYYYAGASEQE